MYFMHPSNVSIPRNPVCAIGAEEPARGTGVADAPAPFHRLVVVRLQVGAVLGNHRPRRTAWALHGVAVVALQELGRCCLLALQVARARRLRRVGLLAPVGLRGAPGQQR